MYRGMSRPVAYSATEKPAGTCKRDPSGRSTTRGRLLADGVANGGGSFTPAICHASATPVADRRVRTKRKRFCFIGVPPLYYRLPEGIKCYAKKKPHFAAWLGPSKIAEACCFI